jgi:hypothetical protein
MFPSPHNPLELLSAEIMKLALQETLSKFVLLQPFTEIWPLDGTNLLL